MSLSNEIKVPTLQSEGFYKIYCLPGCHDYFLSRGWSTPSGGSWEIRCTMGFLLMDKRGFSIRLVKMPDRARLCPVIDLKAHHLNRDIDLVINEDEEESLINLFSCGVPLTHRSTTGGTICVHEAPMALKSLLFATEH
ncbi:unnamed protein product [Pleuronectes platessa]|uniref:Uncharacterized protein n=1 Tax=Pleuronectes platessa TaxID=8262 RepID=A0A9N7YWB3_PLEPL|nr:unnamed protein product [Pleuronectes platessa]